MKYISIWAGLRRELRKDYELLTIKAWFAPAAVRENPPWTGATGLMGHALILFELYSSIACYEALGKCDSADMGRDSWFHARLLWSTQHRKFRQKYAMSRSTPP
jgi:hypothetical protein